MKQINSETIIGRTPRVTVLVEQEGRLKSYKRVVCVTSVAGTATGYAKINKEWLPVTEEESTWIHRKDHSGIVPLEDGSHAICAHDGEVLEVVEEPARKLKMHTLNAIVHLEGRQEEPKDITLTSDIEGYLVISGVVRYVRKDTVFYTWYEIFPVPQEETYMCANCKKAVKEDDIAVIRSIDTNTGSDIGVTYCETCYNNMMNKIYGPTEEQKPEEEPFTPMEVQICDAFPWDEKPFDVFIDNVMYYWSGIDINDAIYSISALLEAGSYKSIEAHKHYESKAELYDDGYQRLYAQTVAIKESDYLRRMTVFSPDVPNGTGYMMFNGEIVPVRFHDRGWYEVGLSKEDADKALSEYPVWEDIIAHAEKWWNSNIRSTIS